MKRLVCAMLACGILCSLTGCGEKTLPRPNFPLEQEVVLAAAEQAGLSWDLAEDETQSSGENQILYTFRHPTETFGDTENKLVVAVVNSALDGDRRYLQMSFESVRVPEKPTFSWEDWKQQLMFAALLYGGFADEDAVYQALSAQETPEVRVSEPLANSLRREVLLWDGVALEGGYCVVNCRTGEVSTASTSKKWASTLSVTFYESQKHFQEMQAEAQSQKEVWVAMTPEEKQAQAELRFENLVETYEIDDWYTLVQTQKETFAPKFELWNRETNQVDRLPTMPEIVELQEIVSPDCFVFSASGKGSESSRLAFPHIIKCFKIEGGDEPFMRVDEEKRFALSEEIHAGSNIPSVLSAVNFSFDGVSFLFAPGSDKEAAFYADAPDIPFTSITYETKTNTLHIFLTSCSFDMKKLVCSDMCLTQNPYIEEYQIQQTENGTTVSLLLRDNASGYYAKTDFRFHPFFSLSFSG